VNSRKQYYFLRVLTLRSKLREPNDGIGGCAGKVRGQLRNKNHLLNGMKEGRTANAINNPSEQDMCVNMRQ